VSQNVYATNKLAWHPDVLEKLRRAKVVPPIFVQWMPENSCPHSCRWCAYGHWDTSDDNPAPAKWKNNQLFSERESFPLQKMHETIRDLKAMGCKAVEITGGGEPTVYRHFDEMVQHLAYADIEVALVTNGSAMPAHRVKRLRDARFIWARVSIDAGDPETYCTTRHVDVKHWERAWKAVTDLSAARNHPECAVGVGYVVDKDNAHGVLAACRLAKQHGADNVRISLSFTPDGTNRWPDGALESVARQVAEARAELEDGSFRVNDISGERAANVRVGWQHYAPCLWKDVACVIGADQNVYACCSWAYNKMGLMFSVKDQSFKDGWFGDGAKWRERHDPRRDCFIHCLQEARNKEAIRLMMDPEHAATVAAGEKPPHSNFV
jgi:MoaA/NifB/PqqE/SkfB family radical SAM enzyme